MEFTVSSITLQTVVGQEQTPGRIRAFVDLVETRPNADDAPRKIQVKLVQNGWPLPLQVPLPNATVFFAESALPLFVSREKNSVFVHIDSKDRVTKIKSRAG